MSATSPVVAPEAVVANGLREGENLKPVKVGIKRKRTPSVDAEHERKENGAKTSAGLAEAREEETGERVVILDAGAQYGKVSGLLVETSVLEMYTWC